MKQILHILALILAIGSITGCKQNNSEANQSEIRMDSISKAFSHRECNSIYYWKTTLKLDSLRTERFVKKHNIGRAYLRFFDIVPDKSPLATEALIPNATLTVNDSLPVGEIIPVVYITDDAIKEMKNREGVWAQKIVERVSNMYSYYDFGNLMEIQLDCDWTQNTEPIFFELCKAVKTALQKKNPNGVVSSTIRLHQLKSDAPPVDYGVLMLYNTGSFRNPGAENSILSIDDVKPYFSNLSSYPLHLDFAYPTYSWNLVFRDGQFYGILRTDITELTKVLRKVSSNKYSVTKDYIINGIALRKGDVIRCEDSPIETVIEVKNLIENKLGDNQNHSNIIYHFDPQNLSKYNDNEIASIFK